MQKKISSSLKLLSRLKLNFVGLMYVWFSIEIPQFVQIDQATWLPETIQVFDWLKIQNLKKSEVQMNCNLVHMFMRSSTKILHFVLNLQKHGCHWQFLILNNLLHCTSLDDYSLMWSVAFTCLNFNILPWQYHIVVAVPKFGKIVLFLF